MTTVVNLRLAQSVSHGYRNEFGTWVGGEKKPERTYLGLPAHELRPVHTHDVWHECVIVHYGYGTTYEFKGRRAAAIWKLWKGKQLNAIHTKRQPKRSNTQREFAFS